MTRGKYIVIEGLDGSGKGTQHQRLVEALGNRAIGVREPGGTAMGEAVRRLVKDSSLPRAPRTNVYLFSAARAELVDQVVEPALAKGVHVVSDRNWLSTVALQRAEGVKDINEIYQLCQLATGALFIPDFVIFLDTDPAVCRQRMNARGGSQGDYFEEKADDFLITQRTLYLQHVRRLPRYQIINGNNSRDTVARDIQIALKATLTLTGRSV